MKNSNRGFVVPVVVLAFALIIGGYAYIQKHPLATSSVGNNYQEEESVVTDSNIEYGSQMAAVTPSVTQSSTTTTTKLPAGSAWLTTLPLGDSKYTTTSPKKGYIYVCNANNEGGGAMVNGPWIKGTTWVPKEKIAVSGKVSWPKASYLMSLLTTTRKITSNDLPTNHTTGKFPIASTDAAYKYDRNPSSITAQNLSFSLPLNPTFATKPNCIYGEVGIMNNGVMLYDAFDAEKRDALAHEVQDEYQGHPNNQGYHYHGFGDILKTYSVSDVKGFAFDGFPITGPKLPNGNYLKTADLDECHGITSEITLDGKKVSMYHYVLTQDFPYSVSCFKGTSVFKPGPAGGTTTTGGQQPPQQGGTPPQEAITACSGKSNGAACTVGPDQHQGICTTIGGSFACKPN